MDEVEKCRDLPQDDSIVTDAKFLFDLGNRIIQETEQKLENLNKKRLLNLRKSEERKNDKLLDFVTATELGEECALKLQDVKEILHFLFPHNKKRPDGASEEKLYLDEQKKEWISVFSNGREISLDDASLKSSEFQGRPALLTLVKVKDIWLTHYPPPSDPPKKLKKSKDKKEVQADQKYEEGKIFLANIIDQKRNSSERIKNVKLALNKVKENTSFDHENVLVLLQFLDTFAVVDTFPRIRSNFDYLVRHARKKYFESFMTESQYDRIRTMRNDVFKGQRDVSLEPEDFFNYLDDNTSVKTFFTTLYKFTERIEESSVPEDCSLHLRETQRRGRARTSSLPGNLLSRFSNNVKRLVDSAKNDQDAKKISNEIVFDLLLNVYPKMSLVESKKEPNSKLVTLRNRLVHAPHMVHMKEIKENVSYALHAIYKYSIALKFNQYLEEAPAEATVSSTKETLDNILQEVNQEFETFHIYLDEIQGEGFNAVRNGSIARFRKTPEEDENFMVSRYLKYMAPILDAYWDHDDDDKSENEDNFNESDYSSSDNDDQKLVVIPGPAMRRIFETFIEWERESDDIERANKLLTIKNELRPYVRHRHYQEQDCDKCGNMVTQICESNDASGDLSTKAVEEVQCVLSALRSLRSLWGLEKIKEISDEDLGLLYEGAIGIDSEKNFLDDHNVLLQRLQVNEPLQKKSIESHLNNIHDLIKEDTVQVSIGDDRIPISIKSAVRNYLSAFHKEYKLFGVTFNSWDNLLIDKSFRKYASSMNKFEKKLGKMICALQGHDTTATSIVQEQFVAPLFAMHVLISETSELLGSKLWEKALKIMLTKGSFKYCLIEILNEKPEAIGGELSRLIVNCHLSAENVYTVLKHTKTKFVEKLLIEIKNYILRGNDEGQRDDESVNGRKHSMTQSFTDVVCNNVNTVFREYVLDGNPEKGLEFNKAFEQGLTELEEVGIREESFLSAERYLIEAKAEILLGRNETREAHFLIKTSKPSPKDLVCLVESAEAHIQKVMNIVDNRITEGQSTCHYILGLSDKSFSFFLLYRASCIYEKIYKVEPDETKIKESAKNKKLFLEQAFEFSKKALDNYEQNMDGLQPSLEKSLECRKYVNHQRLICAKARAHYTLLSNTQIAEANAEERGAALRQIINTWNEVYQDQESNSKTYLEKMKLTAALMNKARSNFGYACFLQKQKPQNHKLILSYHCQTLKNNILAFENLKKYQGALVLLDNNSFKYLKKILECLVKYFKPLIIKGIPMHSNEDVHELICKIGKVLNVDISRSDIEKADRWKTRSPMIEVQFINWWKKEEILSAVRCRRGIKLYEIGFNSTCNFFINEKKTKDELDLENRCKKLKQAGKIASSGYQDDKMYVKVTAESDKRVIRNLEDFQTLEDELNFWAFC
ncbi:uncharacterized protein LOC117645488 [Thrips palmi]|uniref:Uncharacterized protein LOC117645488 n=1 Tax=Thrips palmi TaxID=161013 RepID=A0A6P8ZN27_THRPL|nr:uncharacterized protein LOC117645488 [Thrips palmi]